MNKPSVSWAAPGLQPTSGERRLRVTRVDVTIKPQVWRRFPKERLWRREGEVSHQDFLNRQAMEQSLARKTDKALERIYEIHGQEGSKEGGKWPGTEPATREGWLSLVINPETENENQIS